MKRILQWLRTRRQQAQRNRYISGFNYAIGALVRDEQTPIYFDSILWRRKWGDFDHGIDDAVNKAINLGIVKDDRI